MTGNSLLGEPVGPMEQGITNRFDWRQLLPLILVVLFSIILRVGIASIPLERDEGGYAYIAQRWLAGELPYRDYFDQKPPGAVFVYATLFYCGATSVEAIHWLGHGFLLASVGFIYLIGRNQFSHTIGWLGAFVGVVFLMDSSVLGNASNTELLAILPLAAAMYFSLAAPERGRLGQSFGAGLLGGMALCFKQVVLPIVAFYGAAITIACWRLGGAESSRTVASPTNRVWWLHLICFGIGTGVMPAASCQYFLWRGAWEPFYECVIGYNLTYSRHVPARAYLGMFVDGVRPLIAAQWPLLICVLPAIAQAVTGRARALRPIVAWWLFSFLATSTAGYYRRHYFILLLLPTALLAAHGLLSIARWVMGARPHWHARVATGLAVLACAWPIFRHRAYFFSKSPELACREVYGLNPFPESRMVAERLQDRTQPDDTIYIFGSEPQILFYAQRPSASRYIYIYPLYIGAHGRSDRQRFVVEEVRRNRPRFVVVVTSHITTSFLVQPDSPNILATELEGLLHADYSPFAVVEVSADWSYRWVEGVTDDGGKVHFPYRPDEVPTFQIWERRDSQTAGP